MDMTNGQSRLTSSLSSWKEVVVLLYNVLTWQRDWHPILLASLVSLKFFIIWLWDPTAISCLAVALLNVVLADFLGPILIPYVFKADQWTEGKNETYEMACTKLVSLYSMMCCAFNYYSITKSKKPVMVFSLTVAMLMIVAWMGSVLNNFFILYLLSILTTMMPGLQARGYLAKAIGMLVDKIDGNIRSNKQSSNGNKKLE